MQDRIDGFGLCECGCGQATRIANDSRWGNTAGQPRRFVNGHQQFSREPAWVEADRGYETSCWVWQRAMNNSGYGAVRRDGHMHNAHRFVYIQERGPLPDDVVLDHLCRVRACVNPAHMEPVSNAVNLQRGERTVLNARMVADIRTRVAAGEMQKTLAAEYGVSTGNVCEIVHYKSWKNIA